MDDDIAISLPMNNSVEDGREGRAMYMVECHLYRCSARSFFPLSFYARCVCCSGIRAYSVGRALTLTDSGTHVERSKKPF